MRSFLQPVVLGLHFFFSSRRRHTRYIGDWSSDVCSSDLMRMEEFFPIAIISPAGIPGWPARLTTDADGRFRLTGVGQQRVVALDVSGPKVEDRKSVV